MGRDLRITRIELAAIHIVIIPRLVLVGNEVDAVAALLITIGLFLKLQGIADGRVLRRRCQEGKAGKGDYGYRRNPNLKYFSTRMFR